MTDYQIQRSLDGSTSAIVTESQCLKVGQGVLRRITTTATNAGTLVVFDGTEASTVAVGTLTSTGAMTPASHGQTKLASTGAMVAGTHAVTVFTNAGTQFKDAVKASAVLTSDEAQPEVNDNVVVGGETYTFKAAGTSGSRFIVPLGATAAATMVNLFKAISGNALVDTVHTSTYVITVTAKVAGTAGNSIAATDSGNHLDWDGANTTLTGGLEAETVTIGTTVYTFRDKVKQAYDVKIGASITASLLNLKTAINGTGTTDVTMGAGTKAHTQVIATASDATTVTLRGRVPGLSLNAVATTETCAAASFPDTTLGGGTGASDAGVTTGGATVTIGTTVYTVVDELSEVYGAAPIAYQVKKGAAEANMLDNLKLAINGTASGLATLYSTGTVAHPDVIATTNANDSQIIVSRVVGGDDATTAINAIATTETMANTAWADTTYGGGTGDSNPAVTTSGATMTIGDTTYTFVAELSETSGATAVPYQILHGAAATNALDNMKSAINGTGTIGTLYSTGTLPHPLVIATTNAADSQIVQSKLTGASQNAIITTDNLANYAWGAGTLASGTGATGKMLLNTFTPAAASNVDLGNIEFENGLYVTVGGTSIAATFTFK